MTLPVTVIGGYLGAGKTTLINHLLRHAGGQRLAVLVNEFGALSIDEDLITGAQGEVISVAGGCICCAFGDNLIGALMDMAALTPPPDHIVIEASGVAIPSAIGATLSLLVGFDLNAVLVLADGETIRANAADKYVGDTILRQLGDADLVVLTKGDLVGDLAEVRAWLGARSAAQMVEAAHGALPMDVALGPRAGATGGGTHGDAGFESFVLAPRLEPEQVGALCADARFGLVRAKGFCKDNAGKTYLVQVVGRRWSAVEADGAARGIVCIGPRGRTDQAALAAAMDADRQP